MSTDTAPTPDAPPAAVTPPPNAPSWRAAKPNKLFCEEIRYLIRFAVHPKPVRCAVCKRRVKVMWTMLTPFYAHTMTGFVTVPSEELAPLTMVCDLHPLAPRADILAVMYEAMGLRPSEARAPEDAPEDAAPLDATGSASGAGGPVQAPDAAAGDAEGTSDV